MEFTAYRNTQRPCCGWKSRPDFPPALELMSWIPDQHGLALELGTSDGVWAAALERKGYQLIASDILFDHLRLNCPHVPWRLNVCLDMHDLPIATAGLDLVHADNVLEHSWNIGLAMREIVRVLKPGGYLGCIIPLNCIELSPEAHLWEVQTEAELHDKLLGAAPELALVRSAYMPYGPERQVVMQFMKKVAHGS